MNLATGCVRNCSASGSGAGVFQSSRCVYFHWLRCFATCSVPAPAVQALPEQIRRASISAGCQSTMQQFSRKFSTEHTGSHAPKHQYHIQFVFKIKHSKKRQRQALLLIPQLGTLGVVVFITAVMCDYVIIARSPRSGASSCQCGTQNATNGGRWTTDDGAKPYWSLLACEQMLKQCVATLYC